MSETAQLNVHLPTDAYKALLEIQRAAGLPSPAETLLKLLEWYHKEKEKERPKKYRITSERYDVPKQTIATFVASSDQEALIALYDYSRAPGHAWDRLTLYRIDQEEKKTMLGTNGKQS